MNLCGFEVGLDRPFFLIAGPCVVESEQLQMDVAGRLKEITAELGIPFIFKSSYDKANRSSGTSFRGPGMERGLEILAKVKRDLGVPILTDVHSEAEIPAEEVGIAILGPLRELDEVAYLRFASVYKGFTDLADFEREVGLLQKTTAPKPRRARDQD